MRRRRPPWHPPPGQPRWPAVAWGPLGACQAARPTGPGKGFKNLLFDAAVFKVFGVSNLGGGGGGKKLKVVLSLSPRCVCVCVCVKRARARRWVLVWGGQRHQHPHTTPATTHHTTAGQKERKKKEKSTTPAVRVSSPTTLLVRAHTCLTSLIGREAVFPRGYDRRC